MPNRGSGAPRRKPGEGKRVCPNCGGDEIAVDETSGESVCRSCGLVLSSGAGVEHVEPKAGTEGGIGSGGLGYGKDYAGRELTVRVRDRMRRLHDIERVGAGREHRELKKKAIVARAIERLSLPASYVDDSLELYRGASRTGATAGRSAEVCTAASIYIVARQRGATRTMREVASTLDIDETELRRCYTSIVEGMGLKVTSSDPKLFILKYTPALGVSGEVERRAIDTLIKVKGRREIVGKNPLALAAAAVYLASRELGESVTQRDVSDTFGISDVALRNRLRDLNSALVRE